MNAWHDDVALVYWKLATNAFCFLEAKEPQPSLTLNGLDALASSAQNPCWSCQSVVLLPHMNRYSLVGSTKSQ